MTDDDYIGRQFEDVRPCGAEDKFRVKIVTDSGETKWFRVPTDRFGAVMRAAMGESA